MDLNILATPIVGAIIGYTTNWVAIKMLFRPYNEKRVLGFKLPFTPGLIPKERERIAEAIGEVVEQYLLTDEVIFRELTSQGIKDQLGIHFEKMLVNDNDSINISKLLTDLGFRVEGLSQELTTKVETFLYTEAMKPSVQKEMMTFITDSLYTYLSTKTIDEILNDLGMDAGAILPKVLEHNQVKTFVRDTLNHLVEGDRSFKDLLGEPIIGQLKHIIGYNEPKMKAAILTLLENETFSNKVKAMITELVAQKLGALGAMFANPNTIYDGIVSSLHKQLDTLNLSEHVINYLEQGLDKQIFELVPEHTRINVIGSIEEQLLKPHMWDAFLKNQLLPKTILELFQHEDVVPKDSVKKIIEKSSVRLLEGWDENHLKIQWFLSRWLADKSTQPIQINETQRQYIRNKSVKAYTWTVENFLIQLVKKASVGNIVAKQINTFGVQLLEEMILTIAKKELSAITWLGALLGFIMSIILLVF